MSKERVARLRYYWLVGIFLLYVCIKSGESQNFPIVTMLKALNESREFMRYCDTIDPVYDLDPFANRIVAINKRNFVAGNVTIKSQLVSIGVYINRDHVLTSYTPFRRIASTEERLFYDRDLEEFYVTHFRARILNKWNNRMMGYLLEKDVVTCGRQIFPNSSTDFLQSKRFLHFPNYDLMVLKTKKKREFINPQLKLTFPAPKGQPQNQLYNIVGPLVTKLVNDTTLIGNTFKFVSLGLIDFNHVYNRNHLHTVTLDTNDRLLEDCEEWFDEVNSFICIRNLEEHIGISSGALLFQDGAVLGVGCFTIQKGKESVHVFTDVRNVLQLINTTCTEYDGYPDPTSSTTTKKNNG